MAGNFYESFSHEENTYEYVSSDSYQESQSREMHNGTSKPVVTISNSTETPDENLASGDSLAEGVASSSNQEYGTNYGSTYLEDQYSDYPEEYIDDDGTSPDDDIDESLDDDYSNGDGENSAPADEVADDSQTPQFGRHLISKDKVSTSIPGPDSDGSPRPR
ncbi:hypothetical protein BSL78_20044 [Apostichopus japonicus]|uniref:Uncharacterized protein n=1 Tax=Stichopus japonicus TaxID=307972 RepID=A0A2G8K513_STIJA|nr:hypothetical protein BSL78_20044 [Apostichopus japonicus]